MRNIELFFGYMWRLSFKTLTLLLSFGVFTQVSAAFQPRFYFDHQQVTVVRPAGPLTADEYLLVQEIFSTERHYRQNLQNLSPVIAQKQNLKNCNGQMYQSPLGYESRILFRTRIRKIGNRDVPEGTFEYLSARPSFIFENGLFVFATRNEVIKEGSAYQQTFYHFAPCAEISLIDPDPQFQKGERVCLKTDTTFHRKEQCGKVEYSFENGMSQVRFGILGSKNSEVVSDNDLTTGN